MKLQLRKPLITQINDHIWLMNDNNEATGYVVAGNQSAMVIDTMLGFVNVREEAEKLTDLLYSNLDFAIQNLLQLKTNRYLIWVV